MAAFHFGLMPTGMSETISAARQNVPVSLPLEVVLLLFAFEILQEAGMRIPQLNGQSVSIIGSLVVGQAAVEAKLLSPHGGGRGGRRRALRATHCPARTWPTPLRAVRFLLAVLAASWGCSGWCWAWDGCAAISQSWSPWGCPGWLPLPRMSPSPPATLPAPRCAGPSCGRYFCTPQDRRNQR